MRHGDEDFFDDEDIYGFDRKMQFADPGGKSALRAASKTNPRNLPCPTGADGPCRHVVALARPDARAAIVVYRA
jgi:hypothetical protein